MMRADKRRFEEKGSLHYAACDLSAGVRAGFTLQNGALAHAAAGEYVGSGGRFALPAGCVPEALYFLRSNAFCAAAYAAGKLYFCAGDGGAFAEVPDVALTRAPVGVRVYDGGEALVLSDGVSVCELTAEGVAACEGVAPFACAGYAYERLWICTDGFRVRFSALRDVHDFESGGYIDFPDGKGEILAFADLNNAFYLFRRFGIQKLIAKGTEDEFALSDVPSPAAEIYGAVCTENGKAYFLAEGGLYSFDGRASAPLCPDFRPAIAPRGERGAQMAACRGRIYLSARFGKEEGVGVFREDGSEGYVLLYGAGALAAADLPAGRRALFCKDGQLLELCGEKGAAPALWKSAPAAPFGGREGVLEEVVFSAEGSFSVSVRSEYGERRFEVVSEGGTKRFRTSLRGSEFTFTVLSKGEAGRAFALAAGYSRRA